MEPDLSDAQAAALAGDGDADAFMVLARRYRAPLIGYVTGRLGRRDEAEDIVQEALCRAWREIPRLRQPKKVAGWLYRIAGNLAVSAGRRRNPGPLEADPPADAQDCLEAEQLIDVHRAVADLPEAQRVVVSLRHFGGMSHEEMAVRLGLPIGTVRSRLSRAYERLRPRLSWIVE